MAECGRQCAPGRVEATHGSPGVKWTLCGCESGEDGNALNGAEGNFLYFCERNILFKILLNPILFLKI